MPKSFDMPTADDLVRIEGPLSPHLQMMGYLREIGSAPTGILRVFKKPDGWKGEEYLHNVLTAAGWDIRTMDMQFHLYPGISLPVFARIRQACATTDNRNKILDLVAER